MTIHRIIWSDTQPAWAEVPKGIQEGFPAREGNFLPSFKPEV